MKQKKLIKKIGIVPVIREIYPRQFEYCYDRSLTVLLQSIYKKIEISVLDENTIIKDLDLVIFSGGNDLFDLKKKSDLLRKEINYKILNKVLKKKIPTVGICYGMQLLAKFFRMKIKKKRHLGNHKIFYFENRDKKIKVVNSFHNYVITKLNKNFTPIAYSVDGTIECFLDKKKKILGFMWHPERKKNIIKLESRLFKTICN